VNPAVDRLRLARTESVGPITYRRLLQRFITPARALAELPDLAREGGRAQPLRIPSVDDALRELDALARIGGRMLFADQPDYPNLLALIEDPPPALSVRGDPTPLDRRAVAIVGGRNASASGQIIAEKLAADLAGAGLVVVSGMARGVDAAAHRGALINGTTIAAVAGGVDVAFPPENTELQEQIAASGAVVAEAPFGTAPMARHFPRRNRVIAGLALAVVVIEAAPRSGSLITARLALEYGRELFAVPGSPLDPRCRGSNDLIRQGAHLTEKLEDILAHLPDHPLREGLSRLPLFARGDKSELSEPQAVAPTPLDSPRERARLRRQLIDLLGPTPVSVDELTRRCQVSPAVISAALLELELGGRVQLLPGARVALIRAPDFRQDFC
jgi:DNA processing protein